MTHASSQRTPVFNRQPGRLLNVQRLTAGATLYIPTPGTGQIIVEAVAGGGGGGGSSQGSSTNGAAGGGGSGAYAKHRFTLTGAASYACTVGAGGAGGAAGGANTGATGGATTFTLDVTISLGAGIGGIGMAAGTSTLAAAGGDGGAVTTGGNISSFGGRCGMPGIRDSGTQCTSGNGGSSPLGNGGVAQWNLNPSVDGPSGSGNGGGGSGGSSSDNGNADRAGGAGTDGVIIVYEYT